MSFESWWAAVSAVLPPTVDREQVRTVAALAVAAERERLAREVEATTARLTGFDQPNRVEFALANMRNLRAAVARRIREGGGA